MSKKTHLKVWLTLLVIVFLFEGLFYLYVYFFKPPELLIQKWSIVQILLYFVITFPFGYASRLYANWKTEQVDINLKGLVETFRDCTYGWLFFYLTSPLGFIIWDLLFYGTLPSFW